MEVLEQQDAINLSDLWCQKAVRSYIAPKKNI